MMLVASSVHLFLPNRPKCYAIYL